MRIATRTVIGVLTLAVVSFGYGTAVGAYRVFPFELIKASIQTIDDIFNQQSEPEQLVIGRAVNTDESLSHVRPFEQHIIDDISYSEITWLNNFTVHRSNYLEIEKHPRLAYLNFADDLLEVYSQDNYRIIKDTGIQLRDFEAGVDRSGGIKNLFYHADSLIALVGLVDIDAKCAYASVVNISLGVTALEFPCLPDFEFTNFLGLGGGFAEIVESGILMLSVGTPENTSEAIRALAQDMDSPYGKILAIPESTLVGSTSSYSVYSFGHRNPQSILRVGNQFVAVEHGPRGGDELNIIVQGGNYGWPMISLGSHYSNEFIPKSPSTYTGSIDNYIDPLAAWVPSIATSTITECPVSYQEYYTPNRCVLVGTLKARSLFFVQIDPEFSRVVTIEQYKLGSRIRKVQVEGDSIIVGTDYEGLQSEYDFEGIIFLKIAPIA